MGSNMETLIIRRHMNLSRLPQKSLVWLASLYVANLNKASKNIIGCSC
jgi:hypothetical protein